MDKALGKLKKSEALLTNLTHTKEMKYSKRLLE